MDIYPTAATCLLSNPFTMGRSYLLHEALHIMYILVGTARVLRHCKLPLTF